MSELNKEQIIRKAVELAPGWIIEHDLLYFDSPSNCFSALSPIESPDQEMLDALAAALVREVDKLEGWTLDIVESATYAWSLCGPLLKHRRLGPDRTMNTLTAIVESGVLEKPQPLT